MGLYKLMLSFAEIEGATHLIEDLVATRPDDPAAVTLLAKHYGDTQNRHGEIAALERLFELSPSAETARHLLSLYRLQDDFDREEALLQTLMVNDLIAAGDAERLGFLLASRGDLDGAHAALMLFDEIAHPDRMLGRLALFDLLVQLGDKRAAFARAATWISKWRKASLHRPAATDIPVTRLVRMMLAVDVTEASKIICASDAAEAAPLSAALSPGADCPPRAGEAKAADAQRTRRSGAISKAGARFHERAGARLDRN
jgi:hypothetical protein